MQSKHVSVRGRKQAPDVHFSLVFETFGVLQLDLFCVFPVKGLNKTLPALEDKITQVEALSRKAPSSANMTESIRGIKEIIEETRNYVNKVKCFVDF